MNSQIGQWWYRMSGQAVRDAVSLQHRGIVIGRHGRDGVAVLGGGQHVLLEGPCRSGKTSGVLIPTLLAWPDTVVALTIHRELIHATEGWRAGLGDVYVFDPYGGSTSGRHRYNPLDDIRSESEESDLQRIAQALCGDGGWEWCVHWVRSLFVALAMYLRRGRVIRKSPRSDTSRSWPNRPATLGEMWRLLAPGWAGTPFDAWLRDEPLRIGCSLACKDAFRAYLDLSAPERHSIRLALLTALEPWGDAEIDAATSASDFSLSDGTQLQTVYINLQAHVLARDLFLVRIMFSGLAARAVTAPNRPCLALLDEFSVLGGWDGYADCLNRWRKTQVRAVTVVSDVSQVLHVCGPEAEAVLRAHAMAIRLAAHGSGEPVSVGAFVFEPACEMVSRDL